MYLKEAHIELGYLLWDKIFESQDTKTPDEINASIESVLEGQPIQLKFVKQHQKLTLIVYCQQIPEQIFIDWLGNSFKTEFPDWLRFDIAILLNYLKEPSK